MAAVIRQIVNKALNHQSICCRSLLSTRINNTILPATRFLSTVPTPYEIVDSREDNQAAKGIVEHFDLNFVQF